MIDVASSSPSLDGTTKHSSRRRVSCIWHPLRLAQQSLADQSRSVSRQRHRPFIFSHSLRRTVIHTSTPCRAFSRTRMLTLTATHHRLLPPPHQQAPSTSFLPPTTTTTSTMTARDSSSFSPLSLLFWTALGATSAVLVYKAVFENERSLERRLERKKNKTARKRKPVRIWIDGCFDLMHMGHANAFRQARALGDVLVVGLNTDADIIKYKGTPIMTEEERFVAVSACKWVDEVVRDVPYVMNPEYLEMIFEKYNIDYVVHGDDPCLLPDGTDVFAAAKASGRFRTIARTEGVSTTDIVGRMLLMTKDHFHHSRRNSVSSAAYNDGGDGGGSSGGDGKQQQDEWETASNYDATVTVPFTRETNFLPTARRINQFSNNTRPQPGDRVVYIDGAWDMFHAGHIEILQQAKALGDFLIVGVQNDVNVNKARGSNYPIMNLHERVLSVLACRYVDEVIMGAPWTVTQDMIKTMNIEVVCHGEVRDSDDRKYVIDENGDDNKSSALSRLDERPYRVAEEMGILVPLKSTRKLLTKDIVTRILHARLAFEKKFETRDAKEKVYEANKEFVQEL